MVLWETVDRRLEQASELGCEGLVFGIGRSLREVRHGVVTGLKDGAKPGGAAASRSS
jgi:hypothetical protein